MTESAIRRIADELWDFQMKEAPQWSTFVGDTRWNDRLEERGPAARERRKAAAKAFLERTSAVPAEGLGEEDGITRAVLLRVLAETVESFDHHGWEWDFNQLSGLHIELQDLLAFHPQDTVKGVEDLLARFEAVPAAFEQLRGDMEDGLRSGRVLPRVAWARCVAQLRAFLETPADQTSFARAAANLPASITGADRERLSRSLRAAVDARVIPAYRGLHEFLTGPYEGKAREEVGVSAIPGGREAYAFAVRQQTTTELSPDAIHAIGLEQLEANKAEILAVARKKGHAGDLRSFLDSLLAEKRFRLETREQLLDRYRAILARMDGELPKWFGILPKTPYRVDPMPAYKEKDAPAAYYYPPSDDGKRPGIFFANLHDPPSWPTFNMETLSYHEAVPGHNCQIAVAMEQRGLPSLRRHGHFIAYVEGWAHYTERLADEMGMYSSDEDRVGMMADQAWRAARLVVDTGMHHLGWPRQKAVEVLRSIKTSPEAETHNEVDRYIVWPGQALSYKVGHLEILRLREEARAARGAAFDIRGFHDEVLRHGALPISVLQEVVGRWAAGGGAAGKTG